MWTRVTGHLRSFSDFDIVPALGSTKSMRKEVSASKAMVIIRHARRLKLSVTLLNHPCPLPPHEATKVSRKVRNWLPLRLKE